MHSKRCCYIFGSSVCWGTLAWFKFFFFVIYDNAPVFTYMHCVSSTAPVMCMCPTLFIAHPHQVDPDNYMGNP